MRRSFRPGRSIAVFNIRPAGNASTPEQNFANGLWAVAICPIFLEQAMRYETIRGATRLFLLCCPVISLTRNTFANSDADAWQMIKGLRDQMRSVKTIRSTCDIDIEYASGKAASHKMEYLRTDKKFNILEEASVVALAEGTSTSRHTQRRGVYDGQYLKSYEYNPLSAAIHHGAVQDDPHWLSENDMLNLAGFPVIAQDEAFYEDRYVSGVHEYQLLGREVVGGRACMKLEMKSPYKPGHQCHTFFWIAEDQGHFLLMKYNSLIDNAPDLLLYEKRYRYGDNYGSIPFPAAIEYERYRVDDAGRRSLLFRKKVAVPTVEINEPIDDEEFQFDFPSGTYVQDFVAKISYTVGGSSRDLDESIERLIRSADMEEPPALAIEASQRRGIDPHYGAGDASEVGRPQPSFAVGQRNRASYLAVLVVGITVSVVFTVLYFREKGRRPA